MIKPENRLFTVPFSKPGLPKVPVPEYLSFKTQYFRVKSQQYAKETNQFIGGSEFLVTREFRPEENKILIGSFLKLGAGKGWMYELVLVRKEGSKVFEISPNRHVTGTVVYSGEDWNWTKWVYDASITTGDRINGSTFPRRFLYPKEDTNHLFSVKEITKKDGSDTTRLYEYIEQISKEELELEHRKNVSDPPVSSSSGYLFL